MTDWQTRLLLLWLAALTLAAVAMPLGIGYLFASRAGWL